MLKTFSAELSTRETEFVPVARTAVVAVPAPSGGREAGVRRELGPPAPAPSGPSAVAAWLKRRQIGLSARQCSRGEGPLSCVSGR